MIVLDGTTGITTPAETVSGAITASTVTATGLISGSTNYTGFKNRIINGGMVIDQRNAGASVTPASGVVTYTLDRWFLYTTQAFKLSTQQNAGSVTPPVGFTNYLGATSLSAYAITSTDRFQISQLIEGFNCSDLAWGTASASLVTLTFRVYCSLTGTFGGALKSSGGVRAYPFSYSIPVANTWTTISVTISGDTTGTWLTTNGTGLQVCFSLGAGATFSGTAGAWVTGNIDSATGAVSVVGTSGATFYITGVQLEKGSVATSFDYRPYGTELSLCQRYYYKYSPQNWWGLRYSGTSPWLTTSFPVTMRAVPTVVPSFTSIFCTTGTLNSMPVYGTTVDSVSINYYTSVVSTDFGANLSYTASAEL